MKWQSWETNAHAIAQHAWAPVFSGNAGEVIGLEEAQLRARRYEAANLCHTYIMNLRCAMLHALTLVLQRLMQVCQPG